MDKSNINISLYDINILKNNIKKIMKEKHITQTELSESTGIDQPRISNVLSGKTSECFTVPQLVSISGTLKISVDTLLGIIPPEESEQELCMSDICSKLFDLDKISDMKIGSCRTGKYQEIDNFTHETEEIEVPGIYFNNDKLSNFLNEWNELALSNIGRKETKSKVLELWKAETLKDASKRKRKWEYRTELEEGNRLFIELIEEYDRYLYSQDSEYRMTQLPSYWSKSELSLIENYIKNSPYPILCDIDKAERAIQLAKTVALDEELPFK